MKKTNQEIMQAIIKRNVRDGEEARRVANGVLSEGYSKGDAVYRESDTVSRMHKDFVAQVEVDAKHIAANDEAAAGRVAELEAEVAQLHAHLSGILPMISGLVMSQDHPALESAYHDIVATLDDTATHATESVLDMKSGKRYTVSKVGVVEIITEDATATPAADAYTEEDEDGFIGDLECGTCGNATGISFTGCPDCDVIVIGN